MSKPAVKHLNSPFSFTFWVYIILVCLTWRIGEASNPGPGDVSEDFFTLGAFNPSGLRNKAHYVSSHLSYGDVWTVSETHLSSFDFCNFRRGLHFADSPLKYCVGGHPVPHGDDQHAHAWRGVAVLSKYPTRTLPCDWPIEVQQSSRAMLATTLLDDVWLTGGVLYGEPDAHAYPNHRFHNDQLLYHIASHVCHLAVGPRYVAGDFNAVLGSLESFDVLHRAGFADLQDLALRWWGIQPSNTCKGKSRKDFCFVSPELQSLLVQVSVADDVFPDHSILVGQFHQPRRLVPRTVWVAPRDFPWPDDFRVDPQVWLSSTGTVEDRYASVWAHIETQAVAALPVPVPKKLPWAGGVCPV